MFELLVVALVIMVGWGVSDFIIAYLSKKTGPLSANFWGGFFVLIINSIVYFSLFFPKTVPSGYIWILVVYSVLIFFSFLFLLKACELGKISLVIPITSSYGILAMILSLFFLGESLVLSQYVGISVSTLGLLLATINFHDLKRFRLNSNVDGLKYAVLTFVLWGVVFTIFPKLVREIDWLTPFFFASFLTVGMSFLLLLYKRKSKPVLPDKKSLVLFGVYAVSAQSAFFIYLSALNNFPSALLAPISAGYPAVTIFLAHYFFKERIESVQYLGVVLIISGLVVAAI